MPAQALSDEAADDPQHAEEHDQVGALAIGAEQRRGLDRQLVKGGIAESAGNQDQHTQAQENGHTPIFATYSPICQ